MNHNHTHEAGADAPAFLMTGGEMKTVISKLYALAAKQSTEPDPDWKDEWERGYDAGVSHAGRELKKLLDKELA